MTPATVLTPPAQANSSARIQNLEKRLQGQRDETEVAVQTIAQMNSQLDYTRQQGAYVCVRGWCVVCAVCCVLWVGVSCK